MCDVSVLNLLYNQQCHSELNSNALDDHSYCDIVDYHDIGLTDGASESNLVSEMNLTAVPESAVTVS